MDLKHVPRVSSALKAVDLVQIPAPLIIGERLNTQGSKKAKKLVLSDDFDGLIDLGREQVNDGAHCIDVCVATTERSDELEFMKKLVKRLSLEIDAPLVIDSTDPKVITEAINQIPGRPIINSINLEGDGSRFHSLAPIMAKFGIPSISMCIGPNGMAKTSEDKIKIAKLLFDTGKKFGLKPWQYIFDVLTFTLATGEQEYANSAVETLRGISLVKKEIPGCFTTLGLSNISFGLPSNARKIINSVFLHHALKAGLDTVIINAKDIIPIGEIKEEQIKLAEDLIFNRHANALSDLIYYFENKNVTVTRNEQRLEEINKDWSFDKRCYYRIVNRIKDGIEDDVVGSISDKLGKKLKAKTENIQKEEMLRKHPELAHDAAVETLNEVLLPAMKEVGDKFGAGELILPFVLKSAECMKSAVSELEKYLIKKQGVSKGKLVLCTVYGDVHDIGKNLVKTIFSNNGYTVYDLGKQVPIQQIIDKIKEVQADAVGLSALLVSTSKQMQFFIEKAKELDLKIPALCGGAAINSDYINRIAKADEVYREGVFYCKTAFDGLNVMNKLRSPERDKFIHEWNTKISKFDEKKTTGVKTDIASLVSKIKPASPPIAPHLDTPIILTPSEIDLEEVWRYLNKKSLFVLSWGIRGKSASKMIGDPEALLLEWKKKVIDEALFSPSVVYSYFRCNNQGNRLVVESKKQGEVAFEFPRSSKPKHLCITDYFGKQDIVAFQVVTVGQKTVSKIEELNSNNNYTDAYYLHGLAVETAEALAEWVHHRIRSELNIDKNRGLRYSWGYPSCPDTMQHYLVWKLIDPTSCGIGLTSAGQITPEYSTAAVVVHHPDAEYFIL
ncbi:MAG: dihydropteroate synthase [Nitrososphaeraceae archaeon]|nr:dihydropteroate synthase [Nitrososphaeraceae archaeon]MDW0167580.1 dihydropteroate synthase [Nitrososphaeraceae archaeon]